MSESFTGLVFVLSVDSQAQTFKYWNLIYGEYGTSHVDPNIPVAAFYWLTGYFDKAAPCDLYGYEYTTELDGFEFSQGKAVLRGPVYFPPDPALGESYGYCAYSPTLGLVAMSPGPIETKRMMFEQLAGCEVSASVQLVNDADEDGAYHHGTIFAIAEFLSFVDISEEKKEQMPETWYPNVQESYGQPSREHAQSHAPPVDQVPVQPDVGRRVVGHPPQPTETPMKPAQPLQQGMREPHRGPSYEAQAPAYPEPGRRVVGQPPQSKENHMGPAYPSMRQAEPPRVPAQPYGAQVPAYPEPVRRVVGQPPQSNETPMKQAQPLQQGMHQNESHRGPSYEAQVPVHPHAGRRVVGQPPQSNENHMGSAHPSMQPPRIPAQPYGAQVPAYPEPGRRVVGQPPQPTETPMKPAQPHHQEMRQSEHHRGSSYEAQVPVHPHAGRRVVGQPPQSTETSMKPAQPHHQGTRERRDPSKQPISVDTLAECFSMLRMLQANEEFMSLLSRHRHDKSMFDRLLKRYLK
uniref:Trithorax group protein osa n=1 Tax=Steinernema glaseri TaxID=37863 RepID=A0A1I7YVW0_9BILA